MNHVLKCDSVYWDAIARGDKNFEVRLDDRGFQKGDTVELRKFHAPSRTYEMETVSRFSRAYTIDAEISYVLTGGKFGIEPRFVVLALKNIQLRKAAE